jgi:hypothetical protein
VATGTPDELKRQVGADTVELVTADNPAAAAGLEAAGFRVRRGEEHLVVYYTGRQIRDEHAELVLPARARARMARRR